MVACVPCLYTCQCDMDHTTHFIPMSRIGVSFAELIFVILWAIYAEDGNRQKFLFSFDHGLSIFIATCIFFFIYTQYELLFPDFSLPLGVNVRTKWGYAFCNELTELKKVRVPIDQIPYDVNNAFVTSYRVANAADFWDEPYKKRTIVRNVSKSPMAVEMHVTAAIYALANENHDIVQWLEEQGAKAHKDVDTKEAQDIINYNFNAGFQNV